MMSFNAAPAKDKELQSITLPNYGLIQNKLEMIILKLKLFVPDKSFHFVK